MRKRSKVWLIRWDAGNGTWAPESYGLPQFVTAKTKTEAIEKVAKMNYIFDFALWDKGEMVMRDEE